MMDYKQELQKIEKDLESKRKEIASLESRKEVLEKNKEHYLKELANMGVKPEELDNALTELEIEISQGLESIKEVLNETK